MGVMRAIVRAPALARTRNGALPRDEALPIARPGVSRHLRVLREAGLVEARQVAQRRIYQLQPEALMELDDWLEGYRALWGNRLDALHTEITRGKKARP